MSAAPNSETPRAVVDEEPSEFQLVVSETADQTEIVLTGDLDTWTSPRLRARLTQLIADGHTSLVIDLAGVAFMDSSGLGTLIAVLKRVRQVGGEMALRSPTPPVLRALEIRGLTGVLPIRQ